MENESKFSPASPHPLLVQLCVHPYKNTGVLGLIDLLTLVHQVFNGQLQAISPFL